MSTGDPGASAPDEQLDGGCIEARAEADSACRASHRRRRAERVRRHAAAAGERPLSRPPHRGGARRREARFAVVEPDARRPARGRARPTSTARRPRARRGPATSFRRRRGPRRVRAFASSSRCGCPGSASSATYRQAYDDDAGRQGGVAQHPGRHDRSSSSPTSPPRAGGSAQRRPRPARPSRPAWPDAPAPGAGGEHSWPAPSPGRPGTPSAEE